MKKRLKLIWLNFEEYVAGHNGEVIRGNLTQVCEALCKKDVPLKEILIAVGEMRANRHNVAEFGVFRYGFISTKYDEKYDIRSKIGA